MNTSFSTPLQNFSLPRPVIHKIQVKIHKNTKNTPLYSQSLLHCISLFYWFISLKDEPTTEEEERPGSVESMALGSGDVVRVMSARTTEEKSHQRGSRYA